MHRPATRLLVFPLVVLLAFSIVATPPPALAAAPQTGPVATARLALADYADLVKLGAVATAPDGRRVLYERAQVDLDADERVDAIHELGEGGVDRRFMAGARSPRFSPDGLRVAVLRGGQVWIVPLRGGEPWQATRLPEPVSDFAWAPTGDRLVVVSRDPRRDAPALIPEDRAPEAIEESAGPGGLDPGAWIPAEGASSAGAAQPATPAGDDAPEASSATGEEDTIEGAGDEGRPLPRVIRRLQFKADGEGYLPPRYSHLHLVDLTGAPATAPTVQRLTRGAWDVTSPAFSPDGRWIAFVSTRGPEPDASYGSDLWLVAPGEAPVRLTETPGAEVDPVWAPDGRWIAYRHTPAEPPAYAGADLRLIGLYGPDSEEPPPTDGAQLAPTEAIDLTAALDRRVVSPPLWRPDGTALYVTIQDRGSVPLVRVGTGLTPMGVEGGGLFRRRPRADLEDRGRVRPIVAGPRVVSSFALRPIQERDDDPEIVFVMSEGTHPPEIHATVASASDTEVPMASANAHLQPAPLPAAAELRRLSAANEPLRVRLALSTPEPLRFESDEGVFVEGWLLRPPGAPEAGRLPLVVSLHGGPVAQFTWGFHFFHQWLASRGYAVLALNPRGSSGYGLEFAHALWADWGGPDVRDVVAGLEHLEQRGLIDPRRVGVVGWSYGGVLTNHLITRTDRFAAAVAGASGNDNFSAYGVDDLQRWWEDEAGLPWEPEARELYERTSPIRAVAEIEAPTLFVVGERDVRVPAAQSEQMYQQLRRRMLDGGPTTGLVIYPEEFHVLRRPSFELDFFARTRAWFDRFVLGDTGADPWFGERAW